MKLKDSHIHALRCALLEHGRIEVSFRPSHMQNFTSRCEMEVFRNVILPSNTQYASRLYSWNKEFTEQLVNDGVIYRKSGVYMLTENSNDSNSRIFVGREGYRPTLVVEFPRFPDFFSLFQHWDPYFLSNLGAVANHSAKKFARQVSASGSLRVLFRSNGGLGFFSCFVSPTSADKLFDFMFSRSKFSDIYLGMYGKKI